MDRLARLLWNAALLVALATPAGAIDEPPAAPAGPLSLSAAIRTTLSQNPVMDQAGAGLAASEERLTQARSGFYPQLNVSGAYSRTTNPMMAFGTTLNQARIETRDFEPDRLNEPDAVDNYAIRFSADWAIYDSGQTWHGAKEAALARDAAALARERTRQEAIYRTISAYSDVLLADAAIALTHRAIRTAEANRDLVRSRYDRGFVVKSDLLQAEVHIAHLQRRQTEAESNALVARAALCAAMGIAPTDTIQLSDRLRPGNAPEGSPENWLETAMHHRPDLQAAGLEEEMRAESVQKAKAAHLPALYLSANYETNTEAFDDNADSYTIGAVVNMNLFSGGRLSAGVREAKAANARAAAMRRSLTHQVAVAVRQAYFQAQSAWRQIQTAEAATVQAEEALRIVKDRYDTGLMTIVALLNAELALHQTRTDHLQAVHRYTVAQAGLLLAAGTLEAHVAPDP